MNNEIIVLNARTPILDPKTGLVSREWFKVFEKMGYVVNLINGDLSLTATAGAAAALPATPEKYMAVRIDGVKYKIPLYNT